MKRLILTFLTAVLLAGSQLQASPAAGSRGQFPESEAPYISSSRFADSKHKAMNTVDVTLPAEQVFVPKGFDANDLNVEVMVSTHLPSQCVQLPHADAHRAGGKILVTLHAIKKVSPNLLCDTLAVPQLVTASLGMIPSVGTYSVTVNPATETEQHNTITIEEPKSEKVDNYTYANLDSVSVDGNQAVLNGTTTHDCLEFDRFETIFNGTNTYSVLPIMKQTKELCTEAVIPLHLRYDLPREPSNVPYLLHVRASNGQAINQLVRQ